ncbi:FkbM family methyltransferase [bacterium]|nr:MAG: FkbM family methyltransferase [bacterium]
MKDKLKNRLLDRIRKIEILLDTPGSYHARKAGCYFGTYQMLYHVKKVGINPQSILDIGANTGMFSKTAHFLFPDALILAFEPLKSCFLKLIELEKNIKELECFNVAVGAKNEKTVIHRSEYHYSSSLLEMENLHKEAFPYTAGESLEEIQTVCLDDVLAERVLKRPLLIKIDVQGYEKYVLEGAEKTLLISDHILCEMSFRSLYKGQALFDDINDYLRDKGFIFRGPYDSLKHPETGEVLQIDGLFSKIKG